MYLTTEVVVQAQELGASDGLPKVNQDPVDPPPPHKRPRPTVSGSSAATPLSLHA